MYKITPVERLIQVDALVSVYNYVRPKGFYFPGESHDFWECVYIKEGEVTATADERVYQLGPGKLLMHKPMEFHRIWASEECAPWVINISFRAHGALTDHMEQCCFNLSAKQQTQFMQIVDHFLQMNNMSDSLKNKKYHAQINLIATLLETFLITLSDNENYNTCSLSPNDARYSKIVQVMQNNRQKNLSVSELAELCQMSVSNLKRIFAMYSDVGVAKFFLTLRIRYAMELLEKGMRIAHIAEILNFSDPAYLYTVFKRETGVTPSQYKKQKQNNN